jgi:hypothetical protein
MGYWVVQQQDDCAAMESDEQAHAAMDDCQNACRETGIKKPPSTHAERFLLNGSSA